MILQFYFFLLSSLISKSQEKVQGKDTKKAVIIPLASDGIKQRRRRGWEKRQLLQPPSFFIVSEPDTPQVVLCVLLVFKGDRQPIKHTHRRKSVCVLVSVRQRVLVARKKILQLLSLFGNFLFPG